MNRKYKRLYYVDWQDAFYPAIRPIELAPVDRGGQPYEQGRTFTECKREMIDNARSKVDFWRDQIADYRKLTTKDI